MIAAPSALRELRKCKKRSLLVFAKRTRFCSSSAGGGPAGLAGVLLPSKMLGLALLETYVLAYLHVLIL